MSDSLFSKIINGIGQFASSIHGIPPLTISNNKLKFNLSLLSGNSIGNDCRTYNINPNYYVIINNKHSALIEDPVKTISNNYDSMKQVTFPINSYFMSENSGGIVDTEVWHQDKQDYIFINKPKLTRQNAMVWSTLHHFDMTPEENNHLRSYYITYDHDFYAIHYDGTYSILQRNVSCIKYNPNHFYYYYTKYEDTSCAVLIPITKNYPIMYHGRGQLKEINTIIM